MRIVFTVLLVLSLTLPVFQVKSGNATHSALDYIRENVLDGNWGRIADRVINITEKAFEEKEKSERSTAYSKIKNAIITGYFNGLHGSSYCCN